MLREGPEVSLSGSPTVSPMTAACRSGWGWGAPGSWVHHAVEDGEAGPQTQARDAASGAMLARRLTGPEAPKTHFVQARAGTFCTRDPYLVAVRALAAQLPRMLARAGLQGARGGGLAGQV